MSVSAGAQTMYVCVQVLKQWAYGGRSRPIRRPDSFLERFAMGGKDIPHHYGSRRDRKISDLRSVTFNTMTCFALCGALRAGTLESAGFGI
ncbi:hypothetical protein ACOMHN_061553 [Nucella lapillus]